MDDIQALFKYSVPHSHTRAQRGMHVSVHTHSLLEASKLDRGEGIFRLAYVQIDSEGRDEKGMGGKEGRRWYGKGDGWGETHVNAVSAGFAFWPAIKEPPLSAHRCIFRNIG